jgi:charged multivesicular body protein 7
MSELLTYLVENEPSFRKARLPALYSDFRSQRTLNPDGYEANTSAWRRALARGLRAGLIPASGSSSSHNLLTFTPNNSLLRALESKQYGRPLALGTAIREGLADREFVALPDFLAAKKSIKQLDRTHKRAGSNGPATSWAELPWTLAAWAWRQIGFGAGEGEDKLPSSQHPLVVLANVEAAAKAFADRMQRADVDRGSYMSRVQRTFTQTMFRKQFEDLLNLNGGQRLSAADMHVLQRYLARDKGLIAFDGRAVRIKAENEKTVPPITEEDASIASTRELLEYLDHQTDLLSRRIDELAAKAKEAVAKKNRVAALAALRSKKLAESSLETRLATKSRLEEVADKIEQAADQIALVKVMESSADVLKSLNAQVGGVDKVEDIVERLREQVGQADEVQTILSEPGVIGGGVIDESEIDDEFEAMEIEETAKREEAERRARATDAKVPSEATKVNESERSASKDDVHAEETRRRLEVLDKVGPLADRTKTVESQAAVSVEESTPAHEEKVEETTRAIRRMSLEKQPQPAS